MATTPIVYAKPVRRGAMLVGASWNGQQGDSELGLTVFYKDTSGNTQSVSFQAGGDYPANGSRGRDLFLPATMEDPEMIHPDMMVAHIRAMAFLSGQSVMGTHEFAEAILTSGVDNEKNFHTALGDDVQVTGINEVPADETVYDLTLYCKGGETYVMRVSHSDVGGGGYAFVPSTQLLTLAGHLKKNLGFIHDPPSNLLTQDEMDDTIDCIMSTGDFAPGQSDEGKRWRPFV